MLRMMTTEALDGYSRIKLVSSIDERVIQEARKKFNQYLIRGVISQGKYDDDCWVLYNEVKHRSISFTVPDGKAISDWTGCSTEAYTDYAKAYIMMVLGEMSIETLATISKNLMTFGASDYEDACRWDVDTAHILQFIMMIPDNDGYLGSVAEYIEENRTLNRWCKSPRELSDFGSYLRFDREIKHFWESASDMQKKKYFPVHLWWRLTSILPLRATEFLLLPSDCIRSENDRYYLTVRRTKLKKRRGELGYTIAKDYSKHEYEIPYEMADEIASYRAAVNSDPKHKKDTLFSPSSKSRLGYLTYVQMKSLLEEYCCEVMHDINYPINIGDTRHLAMINLILSGGSPVICRELAGHESIDISANYYANLSTVVESAAYDSYQMGKNEIVFEGDMKIKLHVPENSFRIADGYCDATNIAEGDISECMKNYSRSGKFADCYECIHFYPDGETLRLKLKRDAKDKVDADGLFLMEIIEQVRKGNGAQEDIQQALLRLQNSSADYRSILIRDWEGK